MSSFIVQKGARTATHIGGRLGREEKAAANRRARRIVNERVRHDAEDFDDADLPLWTAYDTI